MYRLTGFPDSFYSIAGVSGFVNTQFPKIAIKIISQQIFTQHLYNRFIRASVVYILTVITKSNTISLNYLINTHSEKFVYWRHWNENKGTQTSWRIRYPAGNP